MMNQIDINSSLYQKLQTIAAEQNCDLRECLERALKDYIDTYGDCKNSDLENLSRTERAFFLSVAE